MKIILFIAFWLGSAGYSSAQTAVYIDPANKADQSQDGTAGHPFDSWTDFAIASNRMYLQKSGTTAVLSGNISLSGRTGVILGAYDAGEKPKIVSSGSSIHVIDITSSSNCTIRDLDIGSTGNATSGIIIDGINSSGNLIDNCNIHDCEWGIRIITASAGNRILRTHVHHTGDDGIFIKEIPDIEIGYCSIYDVNQKWFTNRNESYSPGDCIQIASLNALYFHIHHCQLNHSSTGNKFCIIVAGETYSGLIENNTMTGNPANVTSCLYLGNTSGTVTVRNNLFQRGNYGIYSYVHDLQLHYNVFGGNNYGIRVMTGKSLTALNNSFTDQSGYCISSLTATNVTVLNNVFHLPSAQARAWQSGGLWISDYNTISSEHSNFLNGSSTLAAWQTMTGNDLHSLIGDPVFEEIAAGNLRLRTGSPCIDSGSDVGLVSDFDGVSVPQGSRPDMGAFEYHSDILNVTDIGAAGERQVAIRIFPNPTHGCLIVETPASTISTLECELWDLFGRKIDSRILRSGRESFNLSVLPAGVYLLRLNVKGIIKTCKILKSD